jgi:hypothetical protein
MTPELTSAEIARLIALRQQLDEFGFFVVLLITGTKRPAGERWQERAIAGEWKNFPPVAHLSSTGILGDFLRLFDIDCDDPIIVAHIVEFILAKCGDDPPTRTRENSPRQALVYAALEGAPLTVSITGTKGKLEVIGSRRQLMVDGRHPSGVPVQWSRPLRHRSELTRISEAQVHDVLAFAAGLLDAPMPRVLLADPDEEHEASEPQASIERVKEVLAKIPCVGGFDYSNKIGMCVYRATGGSEEGLLALIVWRSQAPDFNETKVRVRWRHYHKRPPDKLGMGTLIHEADLADQARLGDFLDLNVGRSRLPEGGVGESGGEGVTDSHAVPEAPHSPPESPLGGNSAADPSQTGPETSSSSDKDADAETVRQFRAGMAAAAQPSEPPLPPLPLAPNWPEPIGRGAYVGLLGEIVDATMPTTEGDPNAILIQNLVFFGNAIGISDTTPWMWGGKVKHRTNLTTIALGETAYARKGTATAEPVFLYRRVDPTWCLKNIRGGLHTGEGLIWAVRDELSHPDPKDPLGPPVVVHNASTTKNILVIESEFSVPLTRMQVPGNTLGDLLKQAWDGGKLETLTRHTPVQATGHLVSLIGQDTFASFTAKLPLVSTQDGFANRALLNCVRRSKLLPEAPLLADDVIDGFAQGIQACLRAARLCGEMRRSVRARPLWDQIYRNLNQSKPGLYGAIVSRGHVQVLRLAMLFALFAQRGEIEDTDLMAAMAVWHHCAASAFYLFGEKQADPLAERVLDELRRAGAQGLARTKLYDAFSRNITKSALDNALASLARDGLVRRETAPSATRPIEIWLHTPRKTP